MKYTAYCLLALLYILSLISCDSNEEPCPSYPAKYVLELSNDDFELLGHYRYDGENFTKTSADLDSLWAIANPDGETLESVNEGIFSEITLTSEEMVSFRFEYDGIDSTLNLSYSQYDGNQYIVDLNNRYNEMWLVEIADDCSYIEYCNFILIATYRDRNRTQLRFCRGLTADEFISSDFFDVIEGTTEVLVTKAAYRFYLEN